MRQKNFHPKLFSYVLIAITCTLILGVTIIACQKHDKLDQTVSAGFNAAVVKEWYYGAFKKSNEWGSSPEHGKKLPDWRHCIYRKIGSMEMVEFPLVREKTAFAIPSDDNLSLADRKRIADASLSRILFIKNSNKSVSVREIDYVPDMDYLQRKGFDVSSASIAKEDNDFSGKITIKKWGGTIVSLRLLEAGSIIKKGTVKRNVTNVTFRENSTTTEGCTSQHFCIYQMDCDIVFYGDGSIVQECGQWYNTGDCWDEEYCDDPCVGLTQEQCACEMYGNCGGDDEEVNCDSKVLDVASMGHILSEKISVQLLSQNGSTRTKSHLWRVWIHSDGLFPTYLDSKEESVQTYMPLVGRWEFTSFTHKPIMVEGPTIGYTLTAESESGSPSILPNNNDHAQIGKMTVQFAPKYCIVCKAQICCNTPPVQTTSAEWNVNE